MKTTQRIVSFLCLIAMMISALSATIVGAEEYVFDTPVEPNKWENPHFDTDHAYSFAFVGDTQFITIGDALLGTKKMKAQFKFIADTAEERKLAHVFTLGDLTDWGYRNDSNLAGMHYAIPKTGEWEVVKEAISQLDGVVPYSIVRGNHDDYMIDDYFNVPEYTDLFEGCGGFYSDSNGIQPEKREPMNKDNCIYWSAISGCHDESIVNSWKTVEICGTKYLFITYDYNPTGNVVNWLDEILGKYPDHKAIITTHAYLSESGTRLTPEQEVGNTNNYLGLTGSVLWDRVFKKHANVFMIVSGHTGDEYVNYSYARGDHGNKVLQVLIDPQSYETREINEKGEMWEGFRNVQDVGLVLYMNFSADGKRITFDHYSTLLGKFLKEQDFVINLEGENDVDGYIDMAGFSEYGQDTPLITDKSAISFDGVISDGEYAHTRTLEKSEIAKGNINSDLIEYFAYDDSYLYYAFKTEGRGMSEYKMKLRFGSTLYTREQLDRGDHSLDATYTISNDKCTLLSTNTASTPIGNEDIYCKSSYDKASNMHSYEVRIRRGYLADNGSPDNLLSYTLILGSAEHYFKFLADAKNKIAELGINKKFVWTYNYVYFGTRPEPTETPAITTEAPVTETPAVTTEGEAAKSGCGSSIALASVALIPMLSGVAVFAKKRKDD